MERNSNGYWPRNHTEGRGKRSDRLTISNLPRFAPDGVGRLRGAALTEAWGQQIVTDNRPGALGLIATETLARGAGRLHPLAQHHTIPQQRDYALG